MITNQSVTAGDPETLAPAAPLPPPQPGDRAPMFEGRATLVLLQRVSWASFVLAPLTDGDSEAAFVCRAIVGDLDELVLDIQRWCFDGGLAEDDQVGRIHRELGRTLAHLDGDWSVRLADRASVSSMRATKAIRLLLDAKIELENGTRPATDEDDATNVSRFRDLRL